MREYAARRGWTIAVQVREVGSGAAQARSSRETAGGRPPPRDRRSAGVAAGPLGPVGNGSAGDPSGTGTSRRRLRVADRGAGSDHAGRSSDGRPAGRSSPSSKERFCGNELGLAWPMRGRTGNGWAGRQPRPYTLRKSGNCIAPASANPRSLAGLQIGRTSVRRILAIYFRRDNRRTFGAKMSHGCCCTPIRCFGRRSRIRVMIRFAYHGKDRIAEPHDHGILNGSVQLLSWQVGGSSSRPLPNWLLTKVDEITDLELWTRPSRADARRPPVNTSNGMCSSSASNQPRANSMPSQNESQVEISYPISQRNTPGPIYLS